MEFFSYKMVPVAASIKRALGEVTDGAEPADSVSDAEISVA
ncbi:hypothetical protein [uncultured Eubacterium sp.]|nr:hypothetical protein [uncultured Eubacterium sp.]